jgi:hypothetical protein
MATKRKQTTRKLLMTDPIGFCYNAQTADSNAFQTKTSLNNKESEYLARKEFNLFVDQLIVKGVEVLLANGQMQTPDAVFPNNVFSTTHDGRFFYFPMANENRRQEREIGYDLLLQNHGFHINETIDLSELEKQGQFLEGTGSMIFHHPSETLFMSRSIRSQEKALNAFCKYSPHNAILLEALDANKKEIYHTNVVLSIGNGWMIACLEAISQHDEIKFWCEQNQIELIEINLEQMNQFGANVLEVEGKNSPLGVISETAWKAYTTQQKRDWEKFLEPLIVSIPTIETIGGGSARCMMAEIFLP